MQIFLFLPFRPIPTACPATPLPAVLAACGPQDLANAAWGFAKLGHRAQGGGSEDWGVYWPMGHGIGHRRRNLLGEPAPPSLLPGGGGVVPPSSQMEASRQPLMPHKREGGGRVRSLLGGLALHMGPFPFRPGRRMEAPLLPQRDSDAGPRAAGTAARARPNLSAGFFSSRTPR